jgi:energy-coupling factor transporter ATP-binding protein EcfA2
MLDLVKVHDDIFIFLNECRVKKSNFRFILRKSNHGNKLEEGYWFYGNDDYLALSFWNGIDWKNRTPNIALILTKDGRSFLEINVADSESKRKFVEQNLVSVLSLKPFGKKYLKEYDFFGNDYLESIRNFIEFDKEKIDFLIRDIHRDILYEEDNSISLISSKEFQKWNNKIQKYRKVKEELENDDDLYISEDKPIKVLSITIEDYGNIEELRLNIKSKKNQWIFITGENGSGKTNLLRAIGTTLGHRLLSLKELNKNPHFSVDVKLLSKDGDFDFSRNKNYEARGKRTPITQGLAMYGPYRLDTTIDKISKVNFYKKLSKEGMFRSLFNTAEGLLSIDKQFEFWKKGIKRDRKYLEDRKYFFESVLTDIIPNLVGVNFSSEINEHTNYIFEEPESEKFFFNTWDELSSGTKSSIGLIGDIMIRFYHQQKNILDPSEFKGVVLIDEIDLHLHPLGQKKLVENLGKTFPNIQFIVTTHSPIPLLGANYESNFFKVKRVQNKVRIENLEFIEKYIGELLPNQLLTSDLFGLDSLTSVRNKDKVNVYTGSTITEVYETIELKEKNILRDPDNSTFLEKLKARLNEKG